MKLPFHAVNVCGDILFAATGGNIHSFNSDGAHISCWKYPAEIKAATKNGQDDSKPAPQNDQGPPAKRMKLDNDEPQVRKKGQPKKPGPLSQPSERPMVILMTTTTGGDASHVVAVTSDKSIWVFEHDGQGGLKQLSRRYVDFQFSRVTAMSFRSGKINSCSFSLAITIGHIFGRN